MSKHNDKKFTENLKQQFQGGFEKVFKNGMAQGAYAMCKVIHDKLSDESKPLEDRVAAVNAFCEVFAKLKKEDDEKRANEANSPSKPEQNEPEQTDAKVISIDRE